MTNEMEQPPENLSVEERRKKADELRRLLSNKFNEADLGREVLNVYRENHITDLESKYKNYRAYELFFVLTTGTLHRDTPPAGGCQYFDFPGEDSVETFIRGL